MSDYFGNIFINTEIYSLCQIKTEVVDVILCKPEKEQFPARPKPPVPGNYFKRAGHVLLDAIGNDIYGLEQENIRRSAKETQDRHPKFFRAAGFVSKYCFWLGLANMQNSISQHTGPTIAATIVYGHLFPASVLGKRLFGQTEGLFKLKPDMRAYTTTFMALELASIPLFIYATDTIMRQSSGPVNPLFAASVSAALNLAALGFEYAGFRTIWQNHVLADWQKGTVADDLKGFLACFHPFGIFKDIETDKPKTSAELIGQIWGVIESHFAWLNIARVGLAATFVSLYAVQPADYIDGYIEFYAKMGIWSLFGLVVAKNYLAVEKKLEETKGS